MDVNRTYGVEIEMCANVSRSSVAILLRTALTEVGHTCVTGSYTHDCDANNTDRWQVQTDASVHSSSSDYPHTMEVVSPVLKGVAGLKALKIVCAVLSTVGQINKSCGLHVHHYLKPEERGQHLRNICNAWLDNEKYFIMCLPKSRHNKNYAVQWKRRSPARCTANRDPMSWYRNEIGDRRHSLNLTSINMRGTLEFRCHSGTYEFEKISNWLLVTQRFIIKAMRGDFIFQQAQSFDKFSEFMETDFAPDDVAAAVTTHTQSTSGSPTELTMSLIHPESTKRKLPRPGTKAHTIAMLLLQGATKKAIVEALDEQHGAIGRAKQEKFVAGQLTNMKNPKYSWGFRIQKSRSTGKFRIVPHDGNVPQPTFAEVPEAQQPQVQRVASKLDIRAIHWLKSRKSYFEAQSATARRQQNPSVESILRNMAEDEFAGEEDQ